MFCFKKLFVLVAVVFLTTCLSYAQTTIAFQGFEGTAADNWGYVAPSQAAGPGQVIVGAGNYGAAYAKTGSFSMRAAGGSTACGSGSTNCINGSVNGGSCNNLPNGKNVQFNTINVACLSDVQISVSHRSHILCTGEGQGFDVSENLYFDVSLNGASFVNVGYVGGFGDYVWTYANNPAGSAVLAANPFVYNVPAGTNTVAFRTRTNTNRANEVYYIDDVKITTTTVAYPFPGVAGLWNGLVNTSWNNPCNWENRTVPLITTDVVIPNGAMNNCEILPGVTGNCNDISIDKTLLIESFTGTLNVSGNLIIDNNGLLDMSLGGVEGGTLNIQGNWLNRRNETFFDEGRSTVRFNGLVNQSISIDNDVQESFYKLIVNKLAGTLFANTGIYIDPLNVGGATPMLRFSSGIFDLNSNELIVWNSNPLSVMRTAGGILSERVDNSSSVNWKIGNTIGSFQFPFTTSAGFYIPFTFQQTAGNAGEVVVATYGTPPDNLPWPTTPVNVTNLAGVTGLLPDNRDATVDRFWQISTAGASTATLTFSYTPAELPVPPFDDPFTMRGQLFTDVTDEWLPYLPGQGAGMYFVTVPGVSQFSTWTLTNLISPLPIELLDFNAKLDNKKVEVTWTTAAEINNDYFTVQRSTDGKYFESIGTLNGAGNSNHLISYHFSDPDPYTGVSYYRLMQTDFDGKFTYSNIAAIDYLEFDESFNFQFVHYNSGNNALEIGISGKPGSLNISIVDPAGRVVQKYKTPGNNNSRVLTIPVNNLSTGIYLVTINDEINSVTEKFIIP